MATTKDCGACGHALSLHGEHVTGWMQQIEAESAASAQVIPANATTTALRGPVTPADRAAVTPLGHDAKAEHAPDPTVQIRKLAELRDAGILTEEEFTPKKSDILRRM